MKTWTNAELIQLEISKTEHKWTGIYRDGGYIGDGEISGHLQWCNPTPIPTPSPSPTPMPTPVVPTTTPGDDTDRLS